MEIIVAIIIGYLLWLVVKYTLILFGKAVLIAAILLGLSAVGAVLWASGTLLLGLLGTG